MDAYVIAKLELCEASSVARSRRAAPDLLIRRLQNELDPSVHGSVGIHVFPFGGACETARCIQQFRLARPPPAWVATDQ